MKRFFVFVAMASVTTAGLAVSSTALAETDAGPPPKATFKSTTTGESSSGGVTPKTSFQTTETKGASKGAATTPTTSFQTTETKGAASPKVDGGS